MPGAARSAFRERPGEPGGAAYLAALLGMVFAAKGRADIAFSNYLGTGFDTRWTVAKANGSGFMDYYDTPQSEVWYAYQFTSEATGALSRVTLSLLAYDQYGLTYGGYLNPHSDFSALVQVYADAGDQLGGVMASMDLVGIRTDAIGNYTVTNPDDAVVLYQGQKYWIGLVPDTPLSCVGWYGAFAGDPVNYAEYMWNRNGTGPGPDDLAYNWAYQPGTMFVTVTPEPATLAFVLGGLGLARSLARRKRLYQARAGPGAAIGPAFLHCRTREFPARTPSIGIYVGTQNGLCPGPAMGSSKGKEPVGASPELTLDGGRRSRVARGWGESVRVRWGLLSGSDSPVAGFFENGESRS